jgi:hypothetical protein
MSAPHRGRLVRLAAHALPAGELRDRYRQEFLAELQACRPGARLPYSIGVLTHVLSLRMAVGAGRLGLETAVFTRHRPLLCHLYLHHFEACHNPDGEFYLRCRRCGADRYDPEGRSGDLNIGGNILGGITTSSW